MRRAWRFTSALALVIAACSMLWSAGLFVRTDEYIGDNRALSCATARLVAYVPAVQFEGEPRENFIGWLRSRREMLIALQQGHQCSEETAELLAERVRLDTEALRALKAEGG